VALRLPPYNCDLSAIELSWATVKLRDNNVGPGFSLNCLRDFTAARISSVTKDEWKRYCHHVKIIEEAYYKKDGIVSDDTDRIVISNPNEDSSYGDEGDEAMSSRDSNSDSSDSELAYPLD
jgi:hypothetical protein